MRQRFSGKRTQLAVLIDPDHQGTKAYESLLISLRQWPADIILVGGSTSRTDNIDQVCQELKANSSAPVYLFPGNHFQLSTYADGILTLSLLSGRNPDYLIGRMVEAAPIIHSYELDFMPTGYIMVGDSISSATAYITQTHPIPERQIDLAVQTALAGQYLGMQAIYLEAGSGALQPVNLDLVNAVNKHINIPLIVGGGIRNLQQLEALIGIGVHTVVIGTALEEHPELLQQFHQSVVFSTVYE